VAPGRFDLATDQDGLNDLFRGLLRIEAEVVVQNFWQVTIRPGASQVAVGSP